MIFGFIASKTLNYLVFQSFDFERTSWCLRCYYYLWVDSSAGGPWTISSRGYHPSSDKCFFTARVYCSHRVW